MTPKERVLVAIHHQQPDHVPLGFAGINSGIDRRLKRHFRLADDDNEGLLKVLGIDTRVIEVPYIGPPMHAQIAGRHVDPLWGMRTRWVEHQSGGYWDYCDFPLKTATLDEVLQWPMPSPDDFDYSVVPALCEKYSDYFVVYGNPGVGCIMNTNGMLRTMEQTFVDLALDDEVGLLLSARRLYVQQQVMSRVLDISKGRIDMIWLGEDLGTQNGPLISVEMFRKHIRPNHQRFVDIAKNHNLPIMVHCCGSSSWAFDDFIDMGISVVDTLQPEATNMSPAYLKQKYGLSLSFHGCISTAGPMAHGTAEETARNIRETLDIMMPGGGYILSPTHNIQDNSPVENVIAVYETARAYLV
ncbi:MAG: hypothetical protein A2Y12_12585 [Planctomycetes bacterium GWF2_42_9]|nr:MAG: hypothetical protein A2Y12_12585 [Planctomycetes bacterium GWF2_42_9]